MKIRKNVLIGIVTILVIVGVAGFFYSQNLNQTSATGSAVTVNPSGSSSSSSGTVRTVYATLDHSGGYYFTGDAAIDSTTITVSKGDTVKIIANSNQSSHNHGITIDAYRINVAVTQPDTVIQFNADKAGTFKIWCQTCLDGSLGAHPWMVGTLVVNG